MQRHEPQIAILLATPTTQATAAGAVRLEGGQPVRRFTKELIRCGQYVKEADSLAFSVTPETLKHWAATCSAYLSAGNKIPVPVTHTDDPAANRGWVVDVWEDGKSLFGAIDLVGDEAIKLAGTTDVSIYSPAEHIDGKGNRYSRPILHVALCTDPVVPGLGGFVPVQTSRGSSRQPEPIPLLKLQGASTTMPDPITDPNAPAPGGDPAEAIVAAITDKVMALVKDKSKTTQEKKAAFGDLMKKLEKALGVFDDPATPADESKAGEGEPPVAASKAPKPDPFVVKLARENYTSKLNGLVAAGKITPAVRDSLATQYLADAPLSLALGSKNTDQLDGLLAALDKNASVLPMGERTGQQSLALSRSTPVGDEQVKARKEAGDELRAMTARAAGLRPAK